MVHAMMLKISLSFMFTLQCFCLWAKDYMYVRGCGDGSPFLNVQDWKKHIAMET
eukprot:jgi/Botrbrau1/4914/Bobra.118_1s0027.1